MKRHRKLMALFITIAFLAVLFVRVDRAALLRNLAATHWGFFTLALLAFVPQIGVMAWRWKMLVKPFALIGMRESIEMILAGQTMNLVLPSKMGDLMKGYFLFRTGALDLTRSMSVVVFEKMLDVAALAFLMVTGVVAMFVLGMVSADRAPSVLLAAALGVAAVMGVCLLYVVPLTNPVVSRILGFAGKRSEKLGRILQASHEVVTILQSRGANRGGIGVMSLVLWLLHLGQIYLFFLSLGANAPAMQFLTLVPLAIFIGLVPLTIAGFGTRDAALIGFFPQFASSVMLGVALFVNLRYILPALAGLPFLGKYMVYARER